MKKTILALTVTMLSGCAVIQSTGLTEIDPTLTVQREGIKKAFDNIPPPANGKPVSVAVYSFADKTGQRRPQANVASLSTAVTQGAETFLIQALQNVGHGQWFDVVERVGIDNLVKERTIITQMREAYEGPNAKPLMPMQFAGMILEGGLVGYDTSTTSGGAGMRIFGIGKQTQWSTDTVTVSLRAVSVNTGKVLTSVTVQKTILSTADSATALKFFDQGTQAFEAEAGLTINEPGTYAVKAATELAVVELIKEGQRKGVWDYKKVITAPVIIPETKKEEVKVEEKQDVVVQPQTQSEIKTEAGLTINEPGTYAVKAATELAVVELIKEGQRKGVWDYKKVITTPVIIPETKKEEVKVVEEKKDILVQPQTQSEIKTEAAPSAATKEVTSLDKLPDEVVLKEAQFIYKEPNEKSTKSWQFKKGTLILIVGSEGEWVEVRDAEKRKGFVKKAVILDKQQ